MTCPTTGFGRWVLFGPKIEAEYRRLRDLIYPPQRRDPRTGKLVLSGPDYGTDDCHRYGLSILERATKAGPNGFDMEVLGKLLIEISDPVELRTVNAILAELDELYKSQDLAH